LKYALIVAAGLFGLVAMLVCLAVFTHVFDNHRREGHFDVYSNPKTVDSSVHSSLYYGRHRLSQELGGAAVDPNDPDRILFSSDDIYHGKGQCGTFLYNGQSKEITLIRRWPVAVMWSPNSQYLVLDPLRPSLLEFATGKELDLTNTVSREDGDRVMQLRILQWSPDSQRLAAVIDMSSMKQQNRDWDLVEITLTPTNVTPVEIRYVATIRDGELVWTDEDVHWISGRMQFTNQYAPEPGIRSRTTDDPETNGCAWLDNESADCCCQTGAVRLPL